MKRRRAALAIDAMLPTAIGGFEGQVALEQLYRTWKFVSELLLYNYSIASGQTAEWTWHNEAQLLGWELRANLEQALARARQGQPGELPRDQAARELEEAMQQRAAGQAAEDSSSQSDGE